MNNDLSYANIRLTRELREERTAYGVLQARFDAFQVSANKQLTEKNAEIGTLKAVLEIKEATP